MWDTYFCLVDLLSCVLSNKDIDVSVLTEQIIAGYSSLFASTFYVTFQIPSLIVVSVCLHGPNDL